MTEKCTFLYSSLATDQIQIVNSRRLEDTLSANKIDFIKIDGSLTEHKEVRDKLFSVSGQRGKYPQCFLQDTDGNYRFLGLWEQMEEMIECDTIPAEVLEANPTIQTFKKVRGIESYLFGFSTIYSFLGVCKRCSIVAKRKDHVANLQNHRQLIVPSKT